MEKPFTKIYSTDSSSSLCIFFSIAYANLQVSVYFSNQTVLELSKMKGESTNLGIFKLGLSILE